MAKGTLHRMYPGVYSVGHRAVSTEARYLAAIKACGERAVLCGLAAAWLWRLVKGRPPAPEVSAPKERRVNGVRTRRRRLNPGEFTRIRGVPVTTVAMTLLDIAYLPAPQLAKACHEAGVKYQTTPGHLEEVLARRPNTRGARNLRAIMRGDEPVLLSRLEAHFACLLRANGLPTPVTNREAGSHRVDCRWPAQRLTVELQSYRFHNSRRSFEADHHRAREAYARGDEFRSYTWGDVFERPRMMLAELRELLAATYQR